MNRQDFFSYFKTVTLTIIAAGFLVFGILGVVQYQVSMEQTTTKNVDEPLDYALISVLIDKNLYLEQKYPNNYKINLKLAFLYELKKDYENAEMQYKISILKAPIYEYKPQYNLALLYINQDKLQQAQAVMDDIGEKPDKKLIKDKAEIYSLLGDRYYNLGDYQEATIKYKKAIGYFEVIKSKKGKSLEKSLASAYIYLADQKVQEFEINDAITNLIIAKTIINAPIIKYKLAILLMNRNQDLAYEYFNEVFKEEPAIINYETYYSFLDDLALDADLEGKPADAKLYRYKIQKLKDYYNNNLLSTEDLLVTSMDGKVSVGDWGRKYNVALQFTLKNVSKNDIPSLFIEVVFKDKDRVIDSYVEQVIDSKSPLAVNQETPIITLNASTDKLSIDNAPNEVTMQVLASKKADSYKLLLQETNIKEKIQPQRSKVKRILKRLGFQLL